MARATIAALPAALIGRDAELAELRAAVARAAAGSPSVVLLSGETGIGKTALASTILAEEHLTSLYGNCVQVAGDPLPFAPLVQALRRLGDVAAVRRQVERSPDLIRLLPGWQIQASRDGDKGATPSTRLALFQSVLELLDRLGAAGPVVHAVEDLHWADVSTLDLLRYLITNFNNERLVLLCTYRADEVITGTPLAGWLAEVSRLPVTRRVVVKRLGAHETTELVRRLAGSCDPDLVSSTLTRSAGNPLFIEHLVRQGGTGALPTTLHELLLTRISLHTSQTRDLLDVLGVLGRPAPVEVLARMMRIEPVEVERRAGPALDQHVLEVRSDGSLGFAHPAFGEVVSSGLLATQKARLHQRAARVLESGTDATAGELARHCLGAGDLPGALAASVVAGESAEAMYAFADATAAFARAADLAVKLGQLADLRGLLARTAQAAYLAGDAHEAIARAESALDAPGEAVSTAELCERLGAFHFVAGRGPEADVWLTRALETLPATGSDPLAARVYAGLAMLTSAWSRPDEAERWCHSGLAAARACGARREEGLVRNALGMVAALRGDVDSAIDHERVALGLALETGGADDLALAYVNLTHALGLAGRLADVAEVAREGSRLLAQVGLATQFGGLLHANACEALISSGQLGEASRLLSEEQAQESRGIMAAPCLIQAARLATARGLLGQAKGHCARVREILEAEGAPASWLRVAAETAIEVELWAGRPESAHARVLATLSMISGTDEEPFAGMLTGLGYRALADQAERQRDPSSRTVIAGKLPALDQAATACADSGLPHHDALASWQRAERARCTGDSDPQTWATVEVEWCRLEMVLPAAYCAWREAEARLDAGIDAEAIAALRRAHDVARTVGLACLVDETAQLARWHRVDLVPDLAIGEGPDQGGVDPLAAYGLTARELEVLSELAGGSTNREIAVRLFISVKTASVHVSNILRKLDVPGRQQAARVAHRLGVRGH